MLTQQLFSQLIQVISPAVASELTSWIKQLPFLEDLPKKVRKPAVRFVLALSSLSANIVAVWLGDGAIDPTSLEVLGGSGYAFVTALWVYHNGSSEDK